MGLVWLVKPNGYSIGQFSVLMILVVLCEWLSILKIVLASLPVSLELVQWMAIGILSLHLSCVWAVTSPCIGQATMIKFEVMTLDLLFVGSKEFSFMVCPLGIHSTA